MADKLSEGKLPDPALKLADARPVDPIAELDGLPLIKAVKELCALGYVVRSTHRHAFECGGETKTMVGLICTLE